MRGRKPKPTTIKLITGNPGHRPTPPDEPRPSAAIPKCPPHLDAEAKREWRRMAKELDAVGILTTIDRAVFAAYCQAWSSWVRALRSVKKVGMLVKPTVKVTEHPDGRVVRVNGAPIINPYLKLADAAEAKMMRALTEMGMSPSSRSRVRAVDRQPMVDDRRERFFK